MCYYIILEYLYWKRAPSAEGNIFLKRVRYEQEFARPLPFPLISSFHKIDGD